MECFKVEDLSFSYPKAERPALNGVSFSVGTGEFVTVCGLSGSGKSTLLRQLKPVISPHGKSEGRIFFEGKPIEELDQRSQTEKIGFVMQSPDNQSITDKVWHELSFGLESIGLDTSEIQRRTAETAAFFGIESWFESPVDELSGGQKQILNLASAVIMQPSVLILDEPVAQLDPISAEKFTSLLKKINSELGTTVIISEHELDGVIDISTRLIVMSGGSVISDTAPEKAAKKLLEMNEPSFLSLPSPTRICAYLDKIWDGMNVLFRQQAAENGSESILVIMSLFLRNCPKNLFVQKSLVWSLKIYGSDTAGSRMMYLKDLTLRFIRESS